MDLDVPKFDLDDGSQGFTPIALSGQYIDFRHPSFKAPQQVIAKPATLRDLRGDPFLDPEDEKALGRGYGRRKFQISYLGGFYYSSHFE